jgi:hypothetical protein
MCITLIGSSDFIDTHLVTYLPAAIHCNHRDKNDGKNIFISAGIPMFGNLNPWKIPMDCATGLN